jgi:hypothetical protein
MSDCAVLRGDSRIRIRVPGLAALVVPVALALAGGLFALTPRPAAALPLYATRQGLPCSGCHFDPQGGGPRNEFGFNYEKNRHDLAPDVGKWADLILANKLADVLYVGTNFRTQYMAIHDIGAPAKDDLSTTFPMEGAFYVTLAPHSNLTLVYNRDLHDSRDAFALVHDLPAGLYFKVGQFRVPFGLRMDDHTSAMRAGFRDALAGSFGTSGFLPYDPRTVEGGLEMGFTPATGWLASAAITNGGPAFANQSQALAGKVAYFGSRFIAGVSGYHNDATSTQEHDQRGSLYAGLNVTPRLQLVGEAGIGRTTDLVNGERDLRGMFAEADVRLARGWLVRGKYDFIDLDHRVAGLASERYTLESAVTPVPFADILVSLRRIVNENAADENQLLLQWHVYY